MLVFFLKELFYMSLDRLWRLFKFQAGRQQVCNYQARNEPINEKLKNNARKYCPYWM